MLHLTCYTELVRLIKHLPRGGGGGGEGTTTFHFPKFLRRMDVEVLWCVCWLDMVLLLVHCCVLRISCMEGTELHPVSVFRHFSECR